MCISRSRALATQLGDGWIEKQPILNVSHGGRNTLLTLHTVLTINFVRWAPTVGTKRCCIILLMLHSGPSRERDLRRENCCIHTLQDIIVIRFLLVKCPRPDVCGQRM